MNRIVIEYEDGTTAIWVVSDEQMEELDEIITEKLGSPDTLHC